MRKTRIEALKAREYSMLTALDTFYKRDTACTSFGEIARAVGVACGALYWHFGNEENLFDVLFQRICDDTKSCTQQDLESNAGEY